MGDQKLLYITLLEQITYPQFTLLARISEPHGDPAPRVVPSADHTAMKAFNDFLGTCTSFKSKKVSTQRLSTERPIVNFKTCRTKAMILGGLLSLVWKNRLLLMRCGDTNAESV